MNLPLSHLASAVGAVGLSVSTLYGAVVFVDQRYAERAQVETLSLRVEEKILTDRGRFIQERLWEIEDTYGEAANEAPPLMKEEYRRMKQDLLIIHQQVNGILRAYRAHGVEASEHYYDYEQPRRAHQGRER